MFQLVLTESIEKKTKNEQNSLQIIRTIFQRCTSLSTLSETEIIDSGKYFI